MESTASLAVVLLCVFVGGSASASQPNIILIVADDLGWNDVGFHNPSMITPNIDALADSGVIFNHSYVQPVCSPSRTAFMTGIYPFKAGTQHYVIEGSQPVCVPLNFTFLPQYLKHLGYSTHAIGKWHLGFCNWNCTPTYRGFDSYFGYYQGSEDYYTHKTGGYLDYRDNTDVVRNATGEYSAFRFAKEAVDIINNHDKSKPFFIYLPFQSVHAPIEVPKQYEDMYPNVVNIGRRKFCGMVTALDDAIGSVTRALQEQKVFDNTLIFFTADNGGELVAYGNNWPLRGGKHTVWEGGTRVTSFAHGVGIRRTGYTYDGFFHAVDYVPTILAAAGGKPDASIDGVSQWESIRMGLPSQRTEFIYNLDDFFYPVTGRAAIRVGDMKLVDGYPGLYDNWYLPMNETQDTPLEDFIYNAEHELVWLFNLTADPLEKQNLANQMPDVVKTLRARMLEYKKQMVPANFPPEDPKGNPSHFGGVWTPGWC
ncbi:arylsulfatase B-like [Haliotis cracherodii]|uniref:arylsulfatase B-like n=1 Tax=Haliotis cracherodii TaxID=6455 RepID=UPI0039EB0FB9